MSKQDKKPYQEIDDDSFFDKKYLNKKPDNFLKNLTIVAVVLSVLVVGTVFLMANTQSSSMDKINALSDTKSSLAENEEGGFWGFLKGNRHLNLFNKRENILLLGADSNGSNTDPFRGTRTDTIMLINIDHFSNTANIVSIPRDSKVYIADNHGVDKINAAHSFGGPELTIKTIEEMFGIKINHYVVVNTDGIKEIVDAVGGVPVNVEKRMHYTDRAGGLYVNLQSGYQVLDSKHAEQYLRFRHDAISDIGRMERQRLFMKGLVSKLQSPVIIPKLPQIIEVASKYVKTDMNILELSKYAALSKQIDIGESQIATLPGHPSHSLSISYWILEPDKVQDIIDKLIFREEFANPQPGEPVSVSLLYNPAKRGEIDAIKEKLAEKNFVVSCMRTTQKTNSEIIEHSKYVSTGMLKNIKKIMPELVDTHYKFDPENYFCGQTDLTVVLSK
ncbi:MAG: LCP family protein [Candidatus Gastranaerophilaceae bacterium]|jgi:LCP family protein required for cell wall assembly